MSSHVVKYVFFFFFFEVSAQTCWLTCYLFLLKRKRIFQECFQHLWCYRSSSEIDLQPIETLHAILNYTNNLQSCQVYLYCPVWLSWVRRYLCAQVMCISVNFFPQTNCSLKKYSLLERKDAIIPLHGAKQSCEKCKLWQLLNSTLFSCCVSSQVLICSCKTLWPQTCCFLFCLLEWLLPKWTHLRWRTNNKQGFPICPNFFYTVQSHVFCLSCVNHTHPH